MTEFVLPEWPRSAVAVSGTEKTFAVHHIYCVGRNYAEHAREMGTDPDREPPFFFAKSADCVVPGGGRVVYPPRTADLHHEIELVVAIEKAGADIPRTAAKTYIFGYAVGLDLTRRDLQAEAKAKGRPWDVGKSFAMAAPIGALRPAADIGHPVAGAIWFDVNGKRRQAGDLRDMIWRVDEVIAELSTYYTLMPGDLVFTGTPAGVDALSPGDHGHGHIDGVGDLTIEVVAGS